MKSTLTAENLNLLKDYSLRYTGENDLCIRRRRRGKGFQYLDEQGKSITSKKVLQRIKLLVIPPAWEEVSICSSQEGHIQAVGRDSKGRKQYIYHEKWEEFRNNKKFDRLIEFGKSLPDIRKQVDKDLRKRKLIREKVVAVIVRLLEETLIRVGNEVYAEENDSYGLTTLTNKHVDIKGISIYFHFNGKSGKSFELDIKNKTLSRVVSQCQDLPGQHLFQYIDEDGKRQPADSSDVNAYLNSIIEKDFTAKVFRTWGATVLAAENFSHVSPEENDKINNRIISSVVKKTAGELNNTPAVCREYYIHPDIIRAWKEGYLSKVMNRKQRSSKQGLNHSEKAVLTILKHYSNN